ncbi:glycosyltransferase family 2 protein [Intestinibacter sp.]
MCKLTIFTATYNRGHIIENLYNSLKKQNNFDFEWLVIDDGSEDNTEQLFEIWMKENNNFEIRYYKQENKGLIRSLNRGIELANGEYFSKIDSDDYLIDSYIEDIFSWIDTIKNEKNIYGVSGIRGTDKDTPIKKVWPSIDKDKGYIDASDLERKDYNLDADMSEAWRTEVLRKYKFPVWDGEKFAPEQIVFYQIALDGYKIRWFSKIIHICIYKDDGLTKGSSKLEKENPMGYAMMYNHMLEYSTNIEFKLRAALQCNVLSIIAKNPLYILKSKSILCSIIMLPLSVIVAIRRYFQFKKIK